MTSQQPEIDKQVRCKFSLLFDDVTARGHKIRRDDYKLSGSFPVVDQGQECISGYTDEDREYSFSDLPVIVFGDHTRVFKYVDYKFFPGADGVKILKPKAYVYPKYGYYALQATHIESLGYSRHFKLLKEKAFLLPSLPAQKGIADRLDVISNLIAKRKMQLSKFSELVKSRFVEMFGDGKQPTIMIGDVLKTQSGGTPKSGIPKFYADGEIPWINSGELNSPVIHEAQNHITQSGMENSSAKWTPVDSVLIAMYGATAGKVSLLKIRATTNQAICALLPNERFNSIFLASAVSSQSKWMVAQAAGGAQPNISQAIIKKMKIPCPSLERQERFAAFVAEVDKSEFYREAA